MFTLLMCRLINELTGKRSDQLKRSKSLLIEFYVCRFFFLLLSRLWMICNEKTDAVFYTKSLTLLTFLALFI